MADIHTLALWLVVLAADALFGGLPGLRRALEAPLDAVAALGGWFERRLNRARRSDANRTVRGAVVVTVVVALAWAAGAGVRALSGALPDGGAVEGIAVACMLGQRRLVDRVRAVAAALAAGELEPARAALRGQLPYSAATLDAHAAARGGAEAAAARFSDGVVGAAFWYLLAGLPGLFAYRAVGVLARRIGRPGESRAAFGLAAVRLDGALTLVPGLIAGLLIVLAAPFVPGARPIAALRLWLRDAGARLADGAGRAEGAMAGALDVALGGPRPSPDGPVPGGWIGDGRARADAADVRRAAGLLIVACLIAAAAVAAPIVVAGR